MPQPIDPLSTFKPRPERKRGRGARFGRGGGYFPSHLRSDREQQRQQHGFDATVKEILRDEQITSDATVFNVDTHIAHITEDPYFALLDTGASIPVIPSQVAADLNLTLTELETPTRVSMANGAIEYIHQVADLGPIIGFAAVLKSATQTLIGLGPLMDQGYEVHFAKAGVGIFLTIN
jgi:predicted aspartyl protease